jgi:hypothetical protein
VAVAEDAGQPVGGFVGRILVDVPFGGIDLVVAGDDRGRDALGQRVEALAVAIGEPGAQGIEEARARVGKQRLDGRHGLDRLVDALARPGVGGTA